MEIEKAGYYAQKGQTMTSYQGTKEQDMGEKYEETGKTTWNQAVKVLFCYP